MNLGKSHGLIKVIMYYRSPRMLCRVFAGEPPSWSNCLMRDCVVLCRYGYARMYSGVSLDTFQKKMTVQSLTLEGLKNVGPAVAHMAAVEGLDAHRRAVTMRLGLPNS